MRTAKIHLAFMMSGRNGTTELNSATRTNSNIDNFRSMVFSAVPVEVSRLDLALQGGDFDREFTDIDELTVMTAVSERVRAATGVDGLSVRTAESGHCCRPGEGCKPCGDDEASYMFEITTATGSPYDFATSNLDNSSRVSVNYFLSVSFAAP